MRSAIVSAAAQYVLSTDWQLDGEKENFGAGTDKCNLFVHDVLTEAGASPDLPNPGRFWNGPYPPVAGQWADSNYTIRNWRMLAPNETLLPGDVAAERIDYGDASGHVMIVGNDNTLIGTGPARGNYPAGTIEQIPIRANLGDNPNTPHGPLVYRRWVAP